MTLLSLVGLTQWQPELDRGFENLLELLVVACLALAVLVDLDRGIRALVPRRE